MTAADLLTALLIGVFVSGLTLLMSGTSRAHFMYGGVLAVGAALAGCALVFGGALGDSAQPYVPLPPPSAQEPPLCEFPACETLETWEYRGHRFVRCVPAPIRTRGVGPIEKPLPSPEPP